MSEGQLASRSMDPIGPADLVSLLPQNAFATQTTKGPIVELSQPPGNQNWAAVKSLVPDLLVKTHCISLYCSNVFKLMWLSACRVINELIGNLVGHLYFFLMFRYPMDLGGRNFLSTLQFL